MDKAAIPDGLYLKNVETGEYHITGGGCDADKAEIPDGYALFECVDGKLTEYEKKQPDPFLLKLYRLQDSLFSVAHQLEQIIADHEASGSR